MRQVIGARTLDVDAAAFTALRAGYDELVVDLGTGDGKHVLAVARARPSTLVIGLDARPDAMRPTAARAARKPGRGGVPNALFVWASVEALPSELTNIDEVHALMPWGSLLRALVRPDRDVLRTVTAACTPGGGFLVTLNLHAWRPPVPEVGGLPEPTPAGAATQLAPGLAQAGWHLEAADHPSHAQLAALGTSWTKRLGSTRDTLAVLALRGRIGLTS